MKSVLRNWEVSKIIVFDSPKHKWLEIKNLEPKTLKPKHEILVHWDTQLSWPKAVSFLKNWRDALLSLVNWFNHVYHFCLLKSTETGLTGVRGASAQSHVVGELRSILAVVIIPLRPLEVLFVSEKARNQGIATLTSVEVSTCSIKRGWSKRVIRRYICLLPMTRFYSVNVIF